MSVGTPEVKWVKEWDFLPTSGGKSYLQEPKQPKNLGKPQIKLEERICLRVYGYLYSYTYDKIPQAYRKPEVEVLTFHFVPPFFKDLHRFTLGPGSTETRILYTFNVLVLNCSKDVVDIESTVK